ncbi:MAG: DUF3883 domain-containing protein, partial [Atribacterota bacterium]|nr:DUF3883 domain-containing protein [Atribacterota bacterium]
KLGKNEKGEEMIVPDTDSKLVVYFPTEKVTYLNFLIQGPYITTSSRENIPLEDKQNKKLLGEHAKLIAESLSIIRDLGFLNINFLDLLPIHPDNKDKEIVYSVIFDKVKERLLNEKLLPTTDSIYAKASEVLLARGKDLPDLLDQKDLQRLFSKKYWLDINITYDKTRELRDYIINELKVEEVDFESFARKINVDFLQPKSDRWMIDLYSRLLDQKSLWIENRFNQPGILRNKPIIRLKNGEHIVPFNDNGDPQVYLPTGDKTNYKTVKKNLLENDLSLKFLEELGLKKPDLFAEVREFILPKYQKENPEKDGDYYRDFEKLIKVYENEEIPENKKREFLNELSNLSLIISSKNNGEEICLKKPTEIYFSNDDLINYFKEYADVYFVNSLLYKNFDKHKLEVFLRRLGVEDKPRRIEIKANLSDEKKRELRSRRYGGRYVGWTRDISEKDYKYEGLENCFEQFSFEKSMLLWTFLLKNIESLESYEAKRFFEGEYRWKYRYDYTEIFDAKFLKLLQQKKWLIDKNDICRKPSDITVLELPEEYIKKSTNIDLLKEKLGFKPDIYDQLPEEWKNKLEIIKEISAEDLKMLIVKQKKKDLPKAEGESTNWNPEYKPGEIDVPIKEFKPDRIITPDRGGQSYMLEINTSGGLKGTEETNNVKDIPEVINHDDVKKIGEYGEEIVYHALLSEYKEKGTVAETGFGFKVVNKINEELEIFWLNKLSNIGKGYDFVTKKNRKEIEYIEVKTKIHEDNELIQVTGPQWEFARKLYERREGEKYFIYLVTNAGKSNVSIKKIRNPIKLWKEGRLYAHPINLSL